MAAPQPAALPSRHAGGSAPAPRRRDAARDAGQHDAHARSRERVRTALCASSTRRMSRPRDPQTAGSPTASTPPPTSVPAREQEQGAARPRQESRESHGEGDRSPPRKRRIPQNAAAACRAPPREAGRGLPAARSPPRRPRRRATGSRLRPTSRGLMAARERPKVQTTTAVTITVVSTAPHRRW